MRNLLFPLFGLLLLVCAVCKPTDNPSLTDSDYDVYAVYLNTFPFYQNVPPADTIVLADSTWPGSTAMNPGTPWAWVKEELSHCCQQQTNDICCQASQDQEWALLFDKIKQEDKTLRLPIHLSKLSVRHPVQPYSEFEKQFPDPDIDWGNGSTTHYSFGVSKVSFNADQTKALFFGSFVCGGTYGRGELIMLTKTAGVWEIIDTFRFWIA